MKKITLFMVGIGVLFAYFSLNVVRHFLSIQGLAGIALLLMTAFIVYKNILTMMYEDKFTFSLMGLGVLTSVVIGISSLNSSGNYSIVFYYLKQSILGLLIGGGCFFVLGMAGELIFRKEALGGGDIKLMAGIGAFIGPNIYLIVPLSLCIGAIFAIAYKLICKAKKYESENVVPSSPIYYIALIALLGINFGVLDIALGMLCLLATIYFGGVLAISGRRVWR